MRAVRARALRQEAERVTVGRSVEETRSLYRRMKAGWTRRSVFSGVAGQASVVDRDGRLWSWAR